MSTVSAARLDGTAADTPTRKLEGLQAGRFLAAFGVVLFHFEAQLHRELGIQADFSLGAAGVDVFFVISGFVISLTGRRFTHDPPGFFLNRLARIGPLYWVLTIGVFLIAKSAPHLLNTPDISTFDLAKSLAFIPFEKSNGEIKPVLFLGWTLNYEMFFYLLFTISLILRRPCATVLFFLITLSAASLAGPFQSSALDFYTNPILLEFGYGVALHRLYVLRQDLFARYGLLLLATGVVLLALSEITFGPNLHRAFKWGLPAVLIVGGAVALTLEQSFLSRLVVALGDASYSMYLVHAYVLAACFKLIVPALGTITIPMLTLLSVFTAIAVIGASLLSFRLIERPSCEYLRRMIGKLR